MYLFDFHYFLLSNLKSLFYLSIVYLFIYLSIYQSSLSKSCTTAEIPQRTSKNKCIIRCLLFKYRLIFSLVFLYLIHLKTRQIRSRLSLYFKIKHLIIYNYFFIRFGIFIHMYIRMPSFQLFLPFFYLFTHKVSQKVLSFDKSSNNGILFSGLNDFRL